MIYHVQSTEEFDEDMLKIYKSEPKYFEKARKFLEELKEHPRTGIGHPEQLKHYANETWSRQISRKHRLVYEIHDNTVIVILLAAYGHYDDK